MRRRIILVALALVMASCAGTSGSEGVTVVVTTNILGDVVANVVGDDATIEVLMPVGSDPHEFQASSAQVAAMALADLVVANGLGLEEGLIQVFESLAEDGVAVFEIAPLLDPIELAGGHDHDDHEDEEHDEDQEDHVHHEDHALDPHVWMDPLRMATAAEMIGAALETLHPGGGWDERAAAYAAELRATHNEIEQILSVVPADRQVLITNHATMGYFADRYGWEVLKTVIPGGSTTGAPSSADLAELVALIKAEGVPAIFVDSTRNDDLAHAVAAEVGSVVEVVSLHSESLTETAGDAPTLIDLLLFNARSIAGALGGS